MLKTASPCISVTVLFPSMSEAMVLILFQHLWASLSAVPSAHILTSFLWLFKKRSRARGVCSWLSLPQGCLFSCAFLHDAGKSLSWAPQLQRSRRSHLFMLHVFRKYIEFFHLWGLWRRSSLWHAAKGRRSFLYSRGGAAGETKSSWKYLERNWKREGFFLHPKWDGKTVDASFSTSGFCFLSSLLVCDSWLLRGKKWKAPTSTWCLELRLSRRNAESWGQARGDQRYQDTGKLNKWCRRH